MEGAYGDEGEVIHICIFSIDKDSSYGPSIYPLIRCDEEWIDLQIKLASLAIENDKQMIITSF